MNSMYVSVCVSRLALSAADEISSNTTFLYVSMGQNPDNLVNLTVAGESMLITHIHMKTRKF